MNTVMNTTAIRQKLYDYIRVAEDKKVKAIYTMVEEEINEAYDWSSDPAFIAELDKRSAEYKSGKVKGVPWEEVRKEVQASAKKGARK
jgi:putative addiction module component (TIGR02574 family)